MSCPDYCILEENLTFTVQARDASNEAVDATNSVTYNVYEDETSTAILSGSMSKLASQTGFYSEQIACTTDNGFERYKTYTIKISATVSGHSVTKIYSFICVGGSDTVAGTSGALTTTANVKTFLGITGSDDDTLIASLITRATSAIQHYCDRDFVSTTYREFYDGNGCDELILNQFPIISIKMLAVGRQDAFSITNTSSDAYGAYIQITDTSMVLGIQGGTNDGEDTLTLADYSDMSALLDAITALSKDWSYNENTSLSAWSPTELLIDSGLQCFENYCAPQLPETPETSFRIDKESGIVRNYGGAFSSGTQNIIVRYTAGYATIPADLEQICIDLVKLYYDGKDKDSALQSEKIGDYSYVTKLGSALASNLPQTIKDRLGVWSKWSI